MSEVDFNFFLNRKYAQLQQQADATTQNAATNALTGAAAARLDNTKTNLLPGESAAQVAKLGADTRFTNTQNTFYGPQAQANIAATQAGTRKTDEETRGIKQDNDPANQTLGSLRGVLGPNYSLGSITPTRFRAPRLQDYNQDRSGLNAAGLDYVNGF